MTPPGIKLRPHQCRAEWDAHLFCPAGDTVPLHHRFVLHSLFTSFLFSHFRSGITRSRSDMISAYSFFLWTQQPGADLQIEARLPTSTSLLQRLRLWFGILCNLQQFRTFYLYSTHLSSVNILKESYLSDNTRTRILFSYHIHAAPLIQVLLHL